MAWIVRLVSVGAEGEEHSTDVLRIARPDTLADLGTLGLIPAALVADSPVIPPWQRA